MRITLTIDDDVLAAAKQLAERDGKTVGQVISALTRQQLALTVRTEHAQRNGVSLLPRVSVSAKVTPALVKRLGNESS